MTPNLTRRQFLKSITAGLAGLVLLPDYCQLLDADTILLGRVTRRYVHIYSQPDFQSEVIGRKHRDQLLNLYYRLESESGWRNRVWYRIWEGFVHSAHIQVVKINLNTPLSYLLAQGMLAEITVPFSQPMLYSERAGWQPASRLYYGSVHWITGIEEGPDREPWYRIQDYLQRQYFAPAVHLRPITPNALAPISADVPRREKVIEISIADQMLTAFERGIAVRHARVSTGVPPREPLQPDEITTDTPPGNYHITVKTPSRHMGDKSLLFTLHSDAYIGVPWVCFFDESGMALHGTFWHTNFGIRMSSGCVNLSNEDALWLYRWSEPVIAPHERNVSAWGTRVHVY